MRRLDSHLYGSRNPVSSRNVVAMPNDPSFALLFAIPLQTWQFCLTFSPPINLNIKIASKTKDIEGNTHI